MNPQIDSYIQQARAAGQSDEQIKQALTQSGWSQVDVNQAFGLPTPPVAPVSLPPPPHAPVMAGASAMPMGSAMAAEFLDKKTKDTVIWSVVGYFLRSLIAGLAASIGAYMFFTVSVYGVAVYHPGFSFNFGDVIFNSIFGGLVFGLVLAKLYPKLEEISRKYFGNWFYNFYRMIFYPAVIAGVLGLIFAGGFSLLLGGSFFLYLLVVIAGDIIGAYIFAKLMVSKVGQYYPQSK